MNLMDVKKEKLEKEVYIGPYNGRKRESLLKSARGKKFLIAEVKMASPSEGDIIPKERRFKFYELYNKMPVDAVSIVVDDARFKGDYRYIEEFRELSEKPILAKDFIVKKEQLVKAYNAGASAVLLIADMLDDEELAYLTFFARGIGLDVVVESHSDEALERAVKYGDIVGINARDLNTMQVDLDVIAEKASRVPKGKLILSESGVRGPEDIERLKDVVDGFLIGTAILKSDDPEGTLKELLEALHGQN